jgi:hypothetical protein
MPTIKIDDLTTIPVPSEFQRNKTYWQIFPYDGEIDMVNMKYMDEPMTAVQVQFAQMLHHDEYGIVDNYDERHMDIYNRTVKSLRGHGIVVGREYQDLLKRMAKVMANTMYMERPVVITTRPGLGKTQMLISTLIEKIKQIEGYSVVVVTRRVEDALSISEVVDRGLEKDVCFVRPTITRIMQRVDKCLNGKSLKDYEKDKTICRYKNCKQFSCPVKNNHNSHLDHKVVFVTTNHLNTILDDGLLEDLMEYGPLEDSDSGESYYGVRTELFIDENPGLIFNPQITEKMLTDCMAHLKQNKFEGHLINEYILVRMYFSTQFGGKVQYEFTGPHGVVPQLSMEFKRSWWKTPHPDHYNMPRVVNAFIKHGGIRQNKNNFIDYAIGLSRYRDLVGFPFRTVILDGSGLKDLTYNPSDFNILDLPEIRDASRATIHRYPINLSKTFYSNSKTTKKVVAVADEAVSVIGKRKALFITYKQYADKFMKIFAPYPNIRVNHFGNLIGRNKYSDCSVVFFAGLNDWGPMEYFTQMAATSGNKIDLSIVANKSTLFKDGEVNDFYFTLISVGLYQDLMRSNLRVASDTKHVDIYIWSANIELISKLEDLLLGVQVIDEPTPEALQSTRQPGQISSEAKSLLDVLRNSLTEDDYMLKPKGRSILLAKCLRKSPLRIEIEYVFGPIDRSHYPRYKKYAKTYLDTLEPDPK